MGFDYIALDSMVKGYEPEMVHVKKFGGGEEGGGALQH